MTPSILYIACVVGAIGLYLIMRPHRKSTRIVGTILGAGAIAFLIVATYGSGWYSTRRDLLAAWK